MSETISFESLVPQLNFRRAAYANLFSYSITKAVIGMMYDSFFSFVVAYSSLFSLTASSIGFTTNVYNVGALLASIFIRYPKRYLTSVHIVALSLLVVSITFILQALIVNYFFLVFFRFTLGLMENYIYVYSLDIAIEYFPAKLRGRMMSISYVAMQLGPLAMLLIIRSVSSEDININNIRTCLLISSLIPLSCAFHYFFSVKEGPKSLVLAGRSSEAIKLINELSDKSCNKEKLNQFIDNCQAENEKKDLATENNSLKQLFTSRFIYLSITLLLLKIFSTVVSRGISIAVPFLLNQQQNSSDVKINMLYEMIIGNIIIMMKPFLSTINDIPALGRLGSLKLTAFISAISCLFMLYDIKYVSVLGGIAFSFMGANSILVYNYAAEVYPNSHRISGNALMTLSSAIGALVTQYLYVYLAIQGLFVTVFFSFLICILNLIACCTLTEETLGKKIS